MTKQKDALQKKSMKKKLISLLIAVVILVGIFVGLFLFFTHETMDIKYNFTATADGDEEYIIRIPFPIFPHEITNEEGVIKLEKTNTEYGEAYEITVIGNVEIIMDGSEFCFWAINPFPGEAS